MLIRQNKIYLSPKTSSTSKCFQITTQAIFRKIFKKVKQIAQDHIELH